MNIMSRPDIQDSLGALTFADGRYLPATAATAQDFKAAVKAALDRGEASPIGLG